jgi:hypothetical protein
MNENLQSPSPEFITQVEDMMRNWRDCPHGFPEAFRGFAEHWAEHKTYKSSVTYNKWNIEIRPYRVVELAKQPGMPGRTKLHEMLKGLPISRDNQRNESGRLTPEVVRMILERLSVSHSNKKR